MDKPRVYIETSVISYLTARPSRDVITMGRVASTCEWWAHHRQRYQVVISQYVLDEALDGYPEAVQRRREALQETQLLPLDELETIRVGDALIAAKALPKIARLDALHIAVCATAQVPLLLTWNFKHIANVHQLSKIEAVCRQCGYEPPRIITPDALLVMGAGAKSSAV